MNQEAHKKTYHFFVDNTKYDTESLSLVGAQIKAMIANFDPAYSLFLEGVGDKPDEQVKDDTTVTLDTEPPRRFYTVPPATFGNR